MTRTKLERIETAEAGVAAFRISGKLGFHENKKIQDLIEECLKRDFERIVFDFSGLSSLGGGVAKILREFVREFEQKGGGVSFVITSEVVHQFLQDEEIPLKVYDSIDKALSGAKLDRVPKAKGSAKKKGAGQSEQDAGVSPEGRPSGGAAPYGKEAKTEAPEDGPSCKKPPDDKPPADAGEQSGVIFMSYDGGDGTAAKEEKPEKAESGVSAPAGETEASEDGEGVSEKEEPAGSGEEMGKTQDDRPSASDEILSEIFERESDGGMPPEWINKPSSPFAGSAGLFDAKKGKDELNKQLKRKVLELKTLFSISTDFNSIRERKKLIDIFLLTSIAQGGVESAAFFDRQDDVFKLAFSKGLNSESLERIALSASIVETMGYNNTVIPLETFGIDDAEKAALKDEGLEYICAFRQKSELTGLVLLGKRIAGRGMKEDDFEFLRILVNVAQGAYENALMFEREHDRTLGIVKTLISLIEENTLLKGSSEIVSRYVGMLAKNMDYPDEHFKDLIYGTVLRDMGMIKVSDLILRSPRELTKEEWEIIKRHPEDGADMLHRMKFSDHVVEIVKTHHERFNGEGYPLAIRGKEIPFGARIISVVESYAAMINERPNRPALSEKEALDTLKENYGLRYDREIVSQFAKIMEKEIAKSVKPSDPVMVQ
jgi:HD-GYP domain-containing protein (c-di-GMP phosphodiesterase class II)/anti-anti-sigma regulatory factor